MPKLVEVMDELLGQTRKAPVAADAGRKEVAHPLRHRRRVRGEIKREVLR